MTDLNQATCSDIRDAVRAKKVSAVEVTKHFADRAKRLDPKINAFVSMNEKAEEQARAIDEKIALACSSAFSFIETKALIFGSSRFAR